jgi:hypothetical protein
MFNKSYTARNDWDGRPVHTPCTPCPPILGPIFVPALRSTSKSSVSTTSPPVVGPEARPTPLIDAANPSPSRTQRRWECYRRDGRPPASSWTPLTTMQMFRIWMTRYSDATVFPKERTTPLGQRVCTTRIPRAPLPPSRAKLFGSAFDRRSSDISHAARERSGTKHTSMHYAATLRASSDHFEHRDGGRQQAFPKWGPAAFAVPVAVDGFRQLL